MRKIKLIGWVICLSIVGGAVTNGRVSAQHDQRGTNVFNNTAPQFSSGSDLNSGSDSGSDSGAFSGLSPQTLSTATQISQNLTDAYAAYVAAETAASTNPPVYARGPADPNAVCVNPELQRLNAAREEATTFLNGLDNRQAEQIRSSPAFQKLW